MALIDNLSEEELKEIVKNSRSMREVTKKVGYLSITGGNAKTVKDRIEKYNIDISHFTRTHRTERTEENIFIENSTANQSTLRKWYKAGNYTEYKCSICGQEPIWQGKELTLILDHINGINNDDKLENLRWVCPNCNQQLETTGFKEMRTSKIEIPITKEELKQLIRNTPFTVIEQKYNISDKTLKKWCSILNLPLTKKEINSYTEEEWNKI